MSTWITKELTLDLLAITIDGLNKMFNRINEDQPAVTTVVEVPDPETTHPADMPVSEVETVAPVVESAPEPVTEAAPEPAAEAPAPAVDAEALLAEAQTVLRTIAQKGGVEWITGTLFPHFGAQSLTEIPAERLHEVITMATEQATA